ncbi:MAG: hypothetical protein ACREB1_08285 [Sphingomicrobium sp.]
MSHRQCFASSPPRTRIDGWTEDRRVTFCITLATTGSVTLAATAAGLSRKSAYALRKRDPAFASHWDRSIAAARTARQKSRRNATERNKPHTRPGSRPSINFVNRRDADIATRDRFFAALESLRPPHSGGGVAG